MEHIIFIGLQASGKAHFITANKLEPPTYDEGFDTLYYVHISEDSRIESIENPAWVIEKIPKL